MTATAARPPAMTTQRQENCFDALRLIAALCVAVQHAVAHLDASFLWYREGSPWWFFDGVMAFFILSGNMVYASAERCRAAGRPMRDYLRNRVLRIVPALYAYFVAVVIVVIALSIVTPTDLATSQFLGWAVSNVVLAPVYHPDLFSDFGTGVINGSLWTIPVEFGFYLIVPALLWAAARIGTQMMTCIVFLTGLIGVGLLSQSGGEGADQLPARILAVSPLPWLCYFAIGMFVGRIWTQVPQHPGFAGASVLLYCLLSSSRGHVGDELSPVLAVASAIPLAYVAFWVGHHGPSILRLATSRLGDLSFGAYIWHMPVVNVALWFGLHDRLPAWAVVPAAIAATLVLAYASWHLIERPALRLKRYSSLRPTGRVAR